MVLRKHFCRPPRTAAAVGPVVPIGQRALS